MNVRQLQKHVLLDLRDVSLRWNLTTPPWVQNCDHKPVHHYTERGPFECGFYGPANDGGNALSMSDRVAWSRNLCWCWVNHKSDYVIVAATMIMRIIRNREPHIYKGMN